ncbi:Peptide chain release factor 1, mitochondrial [Hypoxylon texense]
MSTELYTSDQHRPKGGRTFRVRGVPCDWNRDSLQSFLAEQDDAGEPAVKSLAKEIHGRSQTATVSFRGTPRRLQINLPPHPTRPAEPQILTLDDAFLGVTTLFAPPEEDHNVDLIAISGLGGHAFGSFKERRGEHMWLRDALPHHITGDGSNNPIARVMIYGYDSSLQQSNSFQNLDDIGNSFLNSLIVLANSTTFRPIVIIAHSLGGLVVKQFLISLSKTKGDDHQRLYQAVYGIVFFGVPHHGMEISSLKPMAGDGPNRALLESIGTNSHVLSQQYEDFQAALGHKGEFEVICFYEVLQSPTAIQNQGDRWKMEGPRTVLVSPQSATHCRPWESGLEYRCPINRTHSEMVKFGPQDEEYEKAVERIKGIVRRAPSSVKSPLQPNLSHEELQCLQSLAFPLMYDRANDIDPAANGTCEWLLRHNTYLGWQASNQGLLWIKGKPGSGKSTLLKHALHNQKSALRTTSSDLFISFFFHGRGDALQKTPIGFLRSITHQVLSQLPAALSDLIREFQRKREQIGKPGQQWQWHERELQDYFELSLPKTPKTRSIWLFVDALDECGKENAVKLFRWLKTLLITLSSTNIQCHICVTCRHYPILDRDCPFEICPEHENAQDISTFVQDQLSASDLADSRIPALITASASGVFMWARLVVSQVLDLDKAGAGLVEIEEQIKVIPPELDELYRRLVQDMSEKPTSLKLIHWICFARRPLSVNELRWAMVVEPNRPQRSLRECQESRNYICGNARMQRRVQTLSCGLIEVILSSSDHPGLFNGDRTDSGTQIVQFIHQSVKDFFIGEGLSILDSSLASTDAAIRLAHFQLSKICIRYLAMEEIRQTTCNEGEKLESDYPFLHYATTSWVSHTKESDGRDLRWEDLLDLFAWPSNALINLWTHFYDELASDSDDYLPKEISLLHIVVRYHILGWLIAILQNASQISIDLDPKDSLGRTPLSWAAWEGHDAVVKLLLATGQVEVNLKDNYGRTPLSWAAAEGHEALVTMLLDTDQVEVDCMDVRGRTPLSWAAKEGNEAVVKLLLATGQVKPDLKDNDGLTPLLYAAKGGYKGVVKLLLATGQVKPDLKDSYGQTPLSHAAERGHEVIIELLLATGQVKPNLKDNDGLTPLSYAAKGGYKGVVKLLLATGQVELDLKDSNGQTPLSHAAKDRNGLTPLSLAIENGHEAVVKLLLATG